MPNVTQFFDSVELLERREQRQVLRKGYPVGLMKGDTTTTCWPHFMSSPTRHALRLKPDKRKIHPNEGWEIVAVVQNHHTKPQNKSIPAIFSCDTRLRDKILFTPSHSLPFKREHNFCSINDRAYDMKCKMESSAFIHIATSPLGVAILKLQGRFWRATTFYHLSSSKIKDHGYQRRTWPLSCTPWQCKCFLHNSKKAKVVVMVENMRFNNS